MSKRNVPLSLSLPLPSLLLLSRRRIDANRHGIDSRPSVKLIPLPSGSTTSRKISWEPKGASLLLRCSSGPRSLVLLLLSPLLASCPYVFYFFPASLLSSKGIRPLSSLLSLGLVPDAAVCFPESGPDMGARTPTYLPTYRPLVADR